MLHSQCQFAQGIHRIKLSLVLRSSGLAIATILLAGSLPGWARPYDVLTRGISTSPSDSFYPFEGDGTYRGIRDRTINNSVLYNPIIIDSTIQNSTVINPVLVNSGTANTTTTTIRDSVSTTSTRSSRRSFSSPCVTSDFRTRCW
jgi:hypothetical protein